MSIAEGSRKRILCGHCNEYLCKTVYFQHKRLYFDKAVNEWLPTLVFEKSALHEQAFRPSSQTGPSPGSRTGPEPMSECEIEDPGLTDDQQVGLDDSDLCNPQLCDEGDDDCKTSMALPQSQTQSHKFHRCLGSTSSFFLHFSQHFVYQMLLYPSYCCSYRPS